MSNFEQHELGFPGARAANLRLRRGIYLLPSLLTVANMVCGFYAVMSTLKGELSDLDTAAKAIGFAIVFDSFDGFVARATGTSSEFGKQFDSLADMVSFGIAPAVLAFTWGVRGILPSELVDIRRIHEIGWWVGLAFAICCAWRLARFNIQGMAPGGGSRYFVGLPCPAAAGLLVAWVHAIKIPTVPRGRRPARGLGSRNQNSHRGLALVGRVDGSGDGRGGVNGEHRTISEF